jgi:hypothetical protein
MKEPSGQVKVNVEVSGAVEHAKSPINCHEEAMSADPNDVRADTFKERKERKKRKKKERKKVINKQTSQEAERKKEAERKHTL